MDGETLAWTLLILSLIFGVLVVFAVLRFFRISKELEANHIADSRFFAMEKTGTAQFLAGLLVDAVGGLGPMALLAGFYILTNVLTQFMSNAASTVLIAPIAIGAATQIGSEPYALLMAIAVAASAGFLTPVAHQSNVLVMGPGGYKFGDYFKTGIVLNVLTFLTVLVVVPLVWPWP